MKRRGILMALLGAIATRAQEQKQDSGWVLQLDPQLRVGLPAELTLRIFGDGREVKFTAKQIMDALSETTPLSTYFDLFDRSEIARVKDEIVRSRKRANELQ